MEDEKSKLLGGGGRGVEQSGSQIEVKVYGSESSSGVNPPKSSGDAASFAVICLLICTGDTARGVLFPTLYGRVTEMGGDKIVQGLTVAAFSAGRVFASPYFGRWSETAGLKKVLSLTSLIIVVGTLLNAFSRSCLELIVAQAVTGIGSGTLGVTRAYVSEQTSGAERTWKTARLTAVQYGGFTVTPFVGSLFAHFLGETDVMYGPFRLTAYTAAAYFLTLLGLLCYLALNSPWFVDYVPAEHRPPVDPKAKKREDMDLRAVSEWSEVDWCLMAGLVLNVATKGSIGVFETLGIPIAVHRFGLSPATAGCVVSSCGAVGVCCLYGMRPLAERFHDTQLMVWGVLVMVASCGLLVVSLLSPSGGAALVQVYALSIFLMYGTGYPIGHTAVLTWFGKLSKQASQGYLQGWFASAGSVGRIVLPAASGLIAELYGLNALICCLTGFLVVTWLCIAANFNLFTRLTK
eukprot:CAMPEP_0172644436 /NCGR_PEP_ID=MMETSP1068-20121228/239210_1 /TAXON_ID=35684 /ORGANISM="Pseudopedinella elastica, Strain CCMP716" /LENGTH=462 /DNA_ID=CAMNT_0013458635 /DNA_START=174 /DNA_END=1562 /DNA_ORIENTATION=+